MFDSVVMNSVLRHVYVRRSILFIVLSYKIAINCYKALFDSTFITLFVRHVYVKCFILLVVFKSNVGRVILSLGDIEYISCLSSYCGRHSNAQ